MKQNSFNLISSDKNLGNLLHAKKMYAVLTNNSIPVVIEGKLIGVHYHLNDGNKQDDYSFDLNLYDDTDLIARFDSVSVNKTIFFTREKAEQKVNAIKESMNRKRIQNSGKFKITKNKYYRVNFSYQGRHYSVQEMGDTYTYEEYTALTCKEDKDFCVCLKEGHMPNLIPRMQIGQTYRDTDLSSIQKLIDEYIDPYLKEKSNEDEEIER